MPRRTAATSPQPAHSWLALDRQVCFAIYAASLAMTKAYRPLLEPLGLTYPQYLVMLVLWETDGLTVSQLGERLGLDSGTLTPLLKRLQALQLLTRLRDAADERRVLLRLTAEGRQLRKLAENIPRHLTQASGCGVEELSDLTRRLHALRKSLAVSANPAA